MKLLLDWWFANLRAMKRDDDNGYGVVELAIGVVVLLILVFVLLDIAHR